VDGSHAAGGLRLTDAYVVSSIPEPLEARIGVSSLELALRPTIPTRREQRNAEVR
jgi:hypothetical protein